MAPILGGEPCVSHDRLATDGLIEFELGSNEFNKAYRLKYKHSKKDEMKEIMKAERAKKRKTEITSSSFNERLGLEVVDTVEQQQQDTKQQPNRNPFADTARRFTQTSFINEFELSDFATEFAHVFDTDAPLFDTAVNRNGTSEMDVTFFFD